MKIVHIYHSSILIENDETQLFFDVFTDIEELIDKSKKIFFFVSHGHGDHFSPDIFKYSSENTYYIISDDIVMKEDENHILVRPGGTCDCQEIKIKTYGSTDRGVSFLVKFENKTIFFAGDLNWWHWAKMSSEEQKKEEMDYKRIVDGIEDVFIDYAFIPVDPRLGNAYYYATEYFLETKKTGKLVPIHFGKNYEVTSQLIKELNDERIVEIVNKKQIFDFN